MESSYYERRKKADKYLEHQIFILSKIFNSTIENFRFSTQEEDFNGVDIWYGKVPISLRVRQHKFMKDITLRLLNDKYGNTELSKLKMGNMAYILNGEIDTLNDCKLSAFYFIDCQKFKQSAMENFQGIETQEIKGSNYHFLAIDLDSLCQKYDDIIISCGKTEITNVEYENGEVKFSYSRKFYPPKNPEFWKTY